MFPHLTFFPILHDYFKTFFFNTLESYHLLPHVQQMPVPVTFQRTYKPSYRFNFLQSNVKKLLMDSIILFSLSIKKKELGFCLSLLITWVWIKIPGWGKEGKCAIRKGSRKAPWRIALSERDGGGRGCRRDREGRGRARKCHGKGDKRWVLCKQKEERIFPISKTMERSR